MAKLKDLLEEQTETNLWLEQIDNRFGELFKQMRADRLDMLEMVREMRPPKPEVIPPEPAPEPEQKDNGKFGLGAWLVGGLLSGLLAFKESWTGFIKGLMSYTKKIPKFIKGFSNAMGSVFKGVIDRLKTTRVYQGIVLFFEDIKNLVSRITTSAKGKITPAVQAVGNFMERVKMFFTNIGTKISGVFNIGDKIRSVMGVLDKFKPIIAGLGSFFAVIGRIFTPIIAIYESFMGAAREIEQLEEYATVGDYISATIKGVIKGLGRLVTVPLDLLKSAIAWITDKLGFETVAEKLKSFSFARLWDGLIDGAFSIADKITKFTKALVAGAGAAVDAALSFDNPKEAFTQKFNKVMSQGESTTAKIQQTAKDTASKLSQSDVPIGIAASANAASARTDMIDKSSKMTTETKIVNISNTYAQTDASTNTNVSNGGSFDMPSPTRSNGSRADAYASF